MRSRKLLFAAILPLTFTSLSSCSSSFVVPTFEGDERIQLNAYGCILPAGVLGSNVNTLTDDDMQKLADAGFTGVYALYEGSCSNIEGVEANVARKAATCEKAALKVLEIAEKYNIKYYPKDWNFNGMYSSHSSDGGSWLYAQGVRTLEDYRRVMKIMFSDENQYIRSSAYAGNYCCDEPCLDEMERVGWQVQAYLERMEELGIENVDCFVNLLPNTASIEGLGGTYDEYLDGYFKYVAPLIGNISYDFYPYLNKNKSFMKRTYLLNLEQVATRIKGTNYQFRTFVQTKADSTGLRAMTNVGDFRLQLFTNLAFGSTYVSFFEYTGKVTDEDVTGQYALIDLMTGKYNWTYDAVKIVNKEVHALDNVITKYNWDGVMYKNADEMIENQNFANLMNPLQSHDRVSIKSCERDALLTTFKHKTTNDDAFMLVNFNDPYTEPGFSPKETTDNKVTLHFNNAKGLLMYRLGQRVVVELPSNGDYTFNLYPGEGRFIIPLR